MKTGIKEIGKNEKNIPCIVVLGMHRSGTSSLAGSLQEMGVYLGEVYQWNPHNFKGNRENHRIIDLNDQLLSYNKASWDYPPPIRKRFTWTDEQAFLRDELINDMQVQAKANQAPFWGFKDPRTLITWPFWADALNEFYLVGTFRHPLLVAASLYNRNKMPFEYAYKIWFDYNQRLIKIYKFKPFKLVNFDNPVELYNLDMAAVAAEYGLKNAECSFFEERLRNQTRDHCKNVKKLPWKVKLLYKKLQEFYLHEVRK